MKIILIKEVRGLGHVGETKEVSDGYARNFLLANGLAREATSTALQALDTQKAKKQKQEIKNKKNKQILAKKINGRSFVVKAKADESGTLYAGIDAKSVAEELKKQGFTVESEEVVLGENIKKIGDYQLELILAGEKVKINIKILNN